MFVLRRAWLSLEYIFPHTGGSTWKKSSYDFAGVGKSLGTGLDPQSIKSKLLPDNVLPQRKPTLKEYKAEIKSKDKRIDQLSKRLMKTEQKYQRHHNMFETKLKMKEESVQKLNRMLACKKEQVTDLSNKLKVNHFFSLRWNVLKLTLIRLIYLPACPIN